MKVGDVMTRDAITIQADVGVVSAMRLMLDRKISGLPVVDSAGSLVGILTEGDFLRRAEIDTERRHPRWVEFLLGPGRLASEYVATHGRKVEEVMTHDVLTATEDMPLADAVRIMEERHVKRLPVVNERRLTGIVSRSDLLRAFVAEAALFSAEGTSDATIRQCIAEEIDRQHWSPQAASCIGVKNGTVELRGIVTDERERTALRVLVENVPGVRHVHDQLTTIEPVTGTVVRSPSETREPFELDQHVERLK
ncbi:MAG: CBS domain-containing protein [Rudaea sp.]|nr:CBS domain-containing protein [Rudaea sp.]